MPGKYKHHNLTWMLAWNVGGMFNAVFNHAWSMSANIYIPCYKDKLGHLKVSGINIFNKINLTPPQWYLIWHITAHPSNISDFSLLYISMLSETHHWTSSTQCYLRLLTDLHPQCYLTFFTELLPSSCISNSSQHHLHQLSHIPHCNSCPSVILDSSLQRFHPVISDCSLYPCNI